MNRTLPAALALLSATTLPAQMINAGGPATGQYLADQGFIGGASYGPANQSDPGWQAMTGIYSTLRYCASCSYDFVEPNGSCVVKLDLIENRPAVATPTVPAAAIGARLFTVTINGISTGTIDIFAAAGAQKPYSPPVLTVPVTNGHLHADLVASKGNASVSGWEINCTPAPPVPVLTVKCVAPFSCPFSSLPIPVAPGILSRASRSIGRDATR